MAGNHKTGKENEMKKAIMFYSKYIFDEGGNGTGTDGAQIISVIRGTSAVSRTLTA